MIAAASLAGLIVFCGVVLWYGDDSITIQEKIAPQNNQNQGQHKKRNGRNSNQKPQKNGQNSNQVKIEVQDDNKTTIN